MDIDKVEKALPIFKSGLSLATGIGVGRIVSGAVELVAPQTSTTGKVLVYIAKLGISGAIGTVVDNNNNNTIDQLFAATKKVVTPGGVD